MTKQIKKILCYNVIEDTHIIGTVLYNPESEKFTFSTYEANSLQELKTLIKADYNKVFAL